MSVELTGLRLPLASFTLDVDDWNDVDPSLVRDVRCHAPQ